MGIGQQPKSDFIRAWCAVAYAFPGLHPDGYEDAGSGWPRVLKRFAAEAWRRADACELADEELYPCDAQWSGLYDRMKTEDRYLKFVRWSEEDAAYVGFCPDHFPWGGVCHGADEEETYHALRELVREEIVDLQAAGRELPAIVTRPMCEPAGT